MTTPTTNPIPSSAPQDLLFNAGLLDQVVTGSAATVPDRLGASRMTMQGAIDTLKAFSQRGAWATGAVYALKDVVTSSGVAYVAVIPHTAGTFATDLAAGRWVVHQGLTVADAASTMAGKGASLIGAQDAAGRVAAGTVEAWLAALSDPEILANAQAGVDPTGAVESTTAIQACINAMGLLPNGGRVVLRGTYLVDTLVMRSNVTLDMTSGAKLNFTAQTAPTAPMIRLGSATTPCVNAKIIGGELDGNRAAHTGAYDEWSPGIMIWGSSDNVIDGVNIHNVNGDCITIGYDSARVVGSDRNIVRYCELYDAKPGVRQALAITYGNENKIIYNRVTGNIDLELNASVGECKNNLVHGNSGRDTAEILGAPRKSTLSISMASLNTDANRYYGNVISNNHVFYIAAQYNRKSVISGNVIVASSATGTNNIMDISGCDDTLIFGNSFDLNPAISVGITEAIRTRGCAGLSVTNNTCTGDSSTQRFHSYVSAYGASVASGHYFFGNRTDSGYYRTGEMQQPSEWARFRIDQVSAGSLTMTQIAGVKCSALISRAGATAIITSVGGGGGASYTIKLDQQCNATAAAASAVTHNLQYTQTASGSNRTITAFTNAPAAGAVSLAAFSFASGGGTGTFFVEALF